MSNPAPSTPTRRRRTTAVASLLAAVAVVAIGALAAVRAPAFLRTRRARTLAEEVGARDDPFIFVPMSEILGPSESDAPEVDELVALRLDALEPIGDVLAETRSTDGRTSLLSTAAMVLVFELDAVSIELPRRLREEAIRSSAAEDTLESSTAILVLEMVEDPESPGFESDPKVDDGDW